MKKVLIFTDSVKGHHMEYLHHLYMMAKDNPQCFFIYAAPLEFDNVKENMNWPPFANVSFDLYDASILSPQKRSLLNLAMRSYNKAKVLKDLVKRHNVQTVFTDTLIGFVPFAAMLLPARTKLSGIIYRIYLYTDKESSLFERMMSRLKYWVMRYSDKFQNIFILNDNDSASALNKIYKTDKFIGLPDPFVPLPNEGLQDLREYYGISKDDVVLSHFGGLAKRKGTLNILDSIETLSNEEAKHYVFIFAGRIYDDIKTDFYEKYRRLKDRVRIIVEDKFCSYEYLAALCCCSDALVCPYLDTSLSSGLVGYASQFSVPVIAPQTGLIGKLVSNYQVGYLLKEVSDSELSSAYSAIAKHIVPNPLRDYCNAHKVIDFTDAISLILK